VSENQKSEPRSAPISRVYAILLSISTAVIALDQWSKIAITDRFTYEGESLQIFSWFNLTLVYNPGVAFGMLRDLPDGLRLWVLILLPPLVLLMLWWVYIRNFAEDEILGPVAMSLVVGGALGNLIDRVRLHKVVDFVDWYYPSTGKCIGIYLGKFNFPLFYHRTPTTCNWPAFNVADSAITVAFVLLVIHAIQADRKSKALEEAKGK